MAEGTTRRLGDVVTFESLTDEQLLSLVVTPSGNVVRDGAGAEIQRRLAVAFTDFTSVSSAQARVLTRLTRWIAGLTTVLAVITAAQLWNLFGKAPLASAGEASSFTWAFAENIDTSLGEAEMCRPSLADLLYAPSMAQNFTREGLSNVFLYQSNAESYRVHAFPTQAECETALASLKQRDSR